MRSYYKNLRQLLPEFETPQQARERKVNLVKDLMAGKRAARKVGRKLVTCQKNSPCSSSICPRCVRQLRNR